MDATSSRSVLAALRGNASDAGFPALAQSIVVALAEGRGRNVSAAIGAAIGAEAGRNETKVRRVKDSAVKFFALSFKVLVLTDASQLHNMLIVGASCSVLTTNSSRSRFDQTRHIAGVAGAGAGLCNGDDRG